MNVTAKIKSKDKHAKPVEITWARGVDGVGAMLAVAQLLAHDKDESPWSPDTLEIRIIL